MFKQFWNSLSLIGAAPHYDDKLIKRITLINQFNFIAIVLFFFSGIDSFILGDTQSIFVVVFFILICLSGLWLNHKQYHSFAISYLFISVSTAIFYFDSYLGITSGNYLYHFPLILGIAFVFDFKEKNKLLFHFSLPLIYLFINVATDYSLFRNSVLTDVDIRHIFAFNLIFSTASIGFFMYVTISYNLKQSAIFEIRINERKATEQAIKQALNEKDILLAEIHHRVKNNLAIITSLFNLQMSKIENEEAKNILLDSKNRVKSMALIHDRLYKNDSLSEIDFSQYTQELIDEIQYSYPTLSNNIRINASVSNVILNVNNAIPCGLILNELLSNCYKHAFKGRENGTIEIAFTSSGNQLKLMVKDDGVGLKQGYEETGSLGLVVVQSLAEQLDGKFFFSVDNGTCFELEFEQDLM